VGVCQRIGARQIEDRRPSAPDASSDGFPSGVYLEDGEERPVPFGPDLYHHPALRAAMDRSRDSGLPSASDRLEIQLPAGTRATFVIFVPIYREGTIPATVEERRTHLEGFVYSPLRVDGLLGGMYMEGAHPGIAFEVYSGTKVDAGHLLYRSDPEHSKPAEEPDFARTIELNVEGQPWTVLTYTLPRFREGSTKSQAGLALGLGVLSSAALFWASWSQHQATLRLRQSEEDVRRLNIGLEERVRHRTIELETANRELEAFSYSVSHDLRGPLRSLDGFSQMLVDQYSDRLDARGREFLQWVLASANRMGVLIDGFLRLAQLARREMTRESVDLSAIAQIVVADLRRRNPGRGMDVRIEPGILVKGDGQLLQVVFDNLLENAWKFTSHRDGARVEIGSRREGGQVVCYVRDNGAGFDMMFVDKLFKPFERLHKAEEFPGHGVGLATVKRIVERHGGRIWAEAAPQEGAAFYFTLEAAAEAPETGPSHGLGHPTEVHA